MSCTVSISFFYRHSRNNSTWGPWTGFGIDADGEGDWTCEPVLADEIEAFIGYLNNKAPPRPNSSAERSMTEKAERLLRWFET